MTIYVRSRHQNQRRFTIFTAANGAYDEVTKQFVDIFALLAFGNHCAHLASPDKMLYALSFKKLNLGSAFRKKYSL